MNLRKTIIIVGAVLFLASGCGSGNASQLIQITCEEFIQENYITESLTVDPGQQITIQLCSNPSTGYAWSEAPQISNPEAISLENHTFTIPEEGSNQPPGTPGIEIWVFTPTSAGQNQLQFDYSRNWEGGEKGTWTFTLEITVQ